MINKINEIYEDSDGSLNISVTGDDNIHSNIEFLLEEIGYQEISRESEDDDENWTVNYYFDNVLNCIISDLVTEFDWLSELLTEDDIETYRLENCI